MFRSPAAARATIVVTAFVMIAAGAMALRGAVESGSEVKTVALAGDNAVPASVTDEVPSHREPPPLPSPPPQPKPPPPPPAPAAVPAGAVCGAPGAMKSESPLSTLTSADAYKKLGAWVDLYDTCIAGNTDPIAALDEMARRGVRTLYLQTSRWKESHDISHVEKVTAFLDRAQLKGISVVGWYLPGFGDLDRDVRRSLAVMNFVTPQGARFSGFAADLETREEVAQDRNRFNNGIAEYSKRIRAASPPGSILAAIVVDPKNNERAPYCSSNYDPSRCRWEGYPWGDIGSNFDVVMPMAYWSVSRGYVPPKCMEAEINSGEYIKSVASKTESLMGRSRPMHVIGGIADCNTLGEVKSYVDAVIGSGYLGGSLYDFETTQVNPRREEIWAELARLNN